MHLCILSSQYVYAQVLMRQVHNMYISKWERRRRRRKKLWSGNSL